MKRKQLVYLALSALVMTSCSSTRLKTNAITYQSVRIASPKDPAKKSEGKIIVNYAIADDGHILVGIKNNTDEIMVIDQTMSFFINTDGSSTSYFDPTIKTSTVTDLSSGTTGASVNLGALGSALGIGGTLGTALSGINVGGSETSGTSTSNTTYIADQPRVTIGPYGNVILSKQFDVNALCVGRETAFEPLVNIVNKPDNAELKFSVCISYSCDGGQNYDKLTTDFYVNAMITVPVSSGRQINDAVQNIFKIKTDAVYEPWWVLIANALYSTEAVVNGGFVDYK
jgi:lipoprotein